MNNLENEVEKFLNKIFLEMDFEEKENFRFTAYKEDKINNNGDNLKNGYSLKFFSVVLAMNGKYNNEEYKELLNILKEETKDLFTINKLNLRGNDNSEYLIFETNLSPLEILTEIENKIKEKELEKTFDIEF